MSFKNKVVIVTGASSGIGAATAKALSENGANVVIVGRNETKLSVVAAQCPNSLVVKADVSNGDDAKRIIDVCIKKYEKLDVLVNNAGISTNTASLLKGDVIESYDNIMNVNVRAVIRLTALAAPHLIKTKGNVINISSIAGFLTQFKPEAINYCISKAALNHFTKCAAVELGAQGVRVNSICPGPVETDFFENSNYQYSWDDLKKATTLGRICEANEVADLVLFLASEKAKGVTGSNYVVDNGVMIKRK